MNKPSGWFRAVCIIAIVLGVLGVLGGLWQLVGLGVGPKLQARMMRLQDPDSSLQETIVVREAQQRELELVRRWAPIIGTLLVIDCMVSLCLVIGGIQSLRLRPKGRTLLIGTLWIAAILEIAQIGPSLAMNYQKASIMNNMMSKLASAACDAPTSEQDNTLHEERAAMDIISKILKVTMLGAMVLGVLVKLVEVGVYVFGANYLGRRDVRALFIRPVAAELAENQ